MKILIIIYLVTCACLIVYYTVYNLITDSFHGWLDILTPNVDDTYDRVEALVFTFMPMANTFVLMFLIGALAWSLFDRCVKWFKRDKDM